MEEFYSPVWQEYLGGVSGIVFTIIIILLFVFTFRYLRKKPISPTAPSQVPQAPDELPTVETSQPEPLLIHCPACGTEISRYAPSCLKCGHPICPTTNPRTTSPTDHNQTIIIQQPVRRIRFISYRPDSTMVPGSRLGGLVSGIHTVFHRHIQKPARLSDYGLYHFNNRPDYFSCTGRNPCRYSLNFIVIYKKINYMQRITNNISANLTSTQATEKAMYNMGKLGFILSLFSILGSGVISPASLIISCIGATYRQTKLTTAGIIISSVMLLLFLIGSCFVYYYLSHEEY